MKYLLLTTCMALPITVTAAEHVRGHYNDYGTYVAPHYRSSPNSTTYDNWSTRDNYNPYTGSIGTRSPSSAYTPIAPKSYTHGNTYGR